MSIAMQIPKSGDEAGKLHSLFKEDWEWRLREFPEEATLLGDPRYNYRLTDLSLESIERRKAHQRDMLVRVQKIYRSRLAGEDVLSYDLFLREKKIEVEGQRFPTELMPISQMGGPHLELPHVVGATRFDKARDYDDYLSRLAAFPTQIDQVLHLMRRGVEKRWVQPAVPLRSVSAQIEGQIVSDAAESAFFKPFEDFPQDIPLIERERVTAMGRKAISEAVMPALRKLDAFIKGVYLPAGRAAMGASALPEGGAYYAYAVRRQTTTNLSIREIHEMGVEEVARIRKEMEGVIQQVGFKGSFQEFLHFLRADPRFYFTKAEDLVMAYRDLCKRIDPQLPLLFAELPRSPYGIREIPEYEAPAQTTAYYQPGAADGSRAGTYWVNTYMLSTRPKYEMEALSIHEAVPGHHLQIARAQELKGLPDFRRHASYTAFVEGWALYAESLGPKMGFYSDPYSKFGQLTYEMWRACRLVVDTGIHALGWSRERAIDYMKENTAKTENDIVVEVDRYIVWPGQALAYKLGELKIKELRIRAQRELGDRFDIRKFHNAVLDDGPLPLNLLEQRINTWIAERKGSLPHE